MTTGVIVNAKLARCIGALGVALLVSTSAPCAPGWTIPEGVRTVDVNGYPLAYVDAGSGVPIVIVHGAWADYRLFRVQVEEFSKSHRVIAVSLRHFYPEIWDGKGADFTYRQQASDVAALVRTLNLGKVHLLGHSRGGGIAVVLAREHPDVLRSLVLAEPSGLQALLNDPSLVSGYLASVKGLSGFVRSSLDAGEARGSVAKKAWEFGNGPGSWDRMSASGRQMITDNVGTMAADAPMEVPAIGCDDVRRFTFPVLFLQSEGAGKQYTDTIAAMRACKPDIGAPVVVPRARHNMHVDNPAFFNEAVLDFVRRN